jgi:hypothetical protein
MRAYLAGVMTALIFGVVITTTGLTTPFWIATGVSGFLVLGVTYARSEYRSCPEHLDKDSFIVLDLFLWWIVVPVDFMRWLITRPSKGEKKATARRVALVDLNEELHDQQELVETLNDPILADMAKQEVARIKKMIRDT